MKWRAFRDAFSNKELAYFISGENGEIEMYIGQTLD